MSSHEHTSPTGDARRRRSWLRERGSPGPRRRACGAWPLFLGLAVAPVAAGCVGDEEPTQTTVTLAALDSLLVELGGIPTGALSRGQRWRMISSNGAGLPPSNFKPEDLPEPRSRGAVLLQVYCVQCHWLPAPQMHSAAEWPVLLRRMLMRARTLRDRMGGAMTTELLGEILMAGLSSSELPSPADADTLRVYLQTHALPAAGPAELTDGPDAEQFVEMCSICHETPSPSAHTAAGWEPVVARMRANMSMMDVQPLTDRQTDRIVAYLKGRGAS